MDAALEQDQADCQQEGVTEHPDYFHLDTDGIEHHEHDKNKHEANMFKKIDIPTLTELREEARMLDMFDCLIYLYVILIPKNLQQNNFYVIHILHQKLYFVLFFEFVIISQIDFSKNQAQIDTASVIYVH